METRVKQLQKELSNKNISAAVLRLPENVVMLSQYWPRNGFSFVLVPADGDACIIAPQGDIDDVYSSSIKDVRLFGWTRLKDPNPFTSIAIIMQEFAKKNRIKENSVIAMEKGFELVAPPLSSGEIRLPGSATLDIVKKAFKTENLVSVTDIITIIRSIKTEKDIEKLEYCNKIAWQGIGYFTELIQKSFYTNEHNSSGLREIDVSSRVEAYIAQQALNNPGVKFCRAWAQVSSGSKTVDAWFPGMIPSAKVIQPGEFVMLELSTVIDGYWCDLTETIVCGQASSNQQKMLNAVKLAQLNAINKISKGMCAGEVDKAARSILEEQGYGKYFVHITGHGTGFAYHEAIPVIAPSSNDVLEEGMVHSVEPGVYIPEVGGVRFEADVLVTDSGCRILGKMD